MAFTGVKLDKGVALEKWLSQVMTGFSNVKDDKVSLFADKLEIIEASHLVGSEERLFLVYANWNLPPALWIIGMFGGFAMYSMLGWSWWMSIPIFMLFTAYVFTSNFLRTVVRLSLRKAGYKSFPRFLNAEELISIMGLRVIADIKKGGNDGTN